MRRSLIALLCCTTLGLVGISGRADALTYDDMTDGQALVVTASQGRASINRPVCSYASKHSVTIGRWIRMENGYSAQAVRTRSFLYRYDTGAWTWTSYAYTTLRAGIADDNTGAASSAPFEFTFATAPGQHQFAVWMEYGWQRASGQWTTYLATATRYLEEYADAPGFYFEYPNCVAWRNRRSSACQDRRSVRAGHPATWPVPPSQATEPSLNSVGLLFVHAYLLDRVDARMPLVLVVEAVLLRFGLGVVLRPANVARRAVEPVPVRRRLFDDRAHRYPFL
jgi:hypothetical protein